MLLGDGLAARQFAPDLGCGGVEIGPRGAQAGFGASDLALHGVVFTHRLEALRRLAARKLNDGIQHGAREAERGRGKAHAEHHVGGQLVERSFFAQCRGDVAECCEFVRNEQILDRIGIGAGALQADHIPDVVHRGAGHREQDGADFRRAIRLAPLAAVSLDDPDMGPQPARLPGAGGKVPARTGPVAAGHDLHFMGDRAPGQDAGRDIENLVGRIGIEIGRRHGADAALAEAPRRGGVGLGDFLLHLHERFERRLGAAKTFGQQRAIKLVLDQGLRHGRRQAPRPLDLVGIARDQRRKRPRTLDEVETGMLGHALPRIVVFCLAQAQWWPIRRQRSRREGVWSRRMPDYGVFQRARPSTKRSARSSCSDVSASMRPITRRMRSRRSATSLSVMICDRRRRPFPGATSISGRSESPSCRSDETGQMKTVERPPLNWSA